MQRKGTARPLLCGLLLLILPVHDVAALDWTDPEPFRRDRLSGREFDYNAESFLHRFSFEPKPALGGFRTLDSNGISTVAGSTRSRELYVRTDAQLELPLDGPAFAGYRFRRDEDFDGRFDQNLVGGGARVNGWQASVWGDVVGAKEDVDVHADLRWQGRQGNRIRAGIVAVDAFFNSKQRDGRYREYPYTYFLSGRWRATENLAFYGFSNVNAPVRLEMSTTGLRSDDEQYSGGVGVDLTVAPAVSASVELEGLYGLREQRALEGEVATEQRLRRSHVAVTAELRQRWDGGYRRWIGLRLLHFAENDRRPAAVTETVERERREYTLYGGQRWALGARTTFAPGVFLAFHDITEEYPDDSDSDGRDVGFYGKFTPALELVVNERTGGVVTLNPTVRLHRAAFGGGNVQVHLPF